MAETPLPSREKISEAVTFAHITDSDGDHLIDIAQAYVEGRLVDREALETVWLCIEKSTDSIGWRVTNLPGSPSSCYFSGGAHTPWCGESILAQALAALREA